MPDWHLYQVARKTTQSTFLVCSCWKSFVNNRSQALRRTTVQDVVQLKALLFARNSTSQFFKRQTLSSFAILSPRLKSPKNFDDGMMLWKLVLDKFVEITISVYCFMRNWSISWKISELFLQEARFI